MQSIEELAYRLIHDESFDHWLRPHQRAVERTSVVLARRLGMPVDRIGLAARCHDVGKLAIADDIWNKPGPLTVLEKKIVALHSELGEQLVAEHVRQGVPRIIRHHQEWFDGNGYPDGLAGWAIPIESRIISVADAFDSLTSDRPYRKGVSPINALVEIWRCSGAQFDPIVVKALEDVLRQGLLEQATILQSGQTA